MALPVAEKLRKATTFLIAWLLWLHALFVVDFHSPLLDHALRALRFTASEAILFALLLALSFLAGSGFWRLLRSLAYIYFFPFVLVGYAGYLAVLVLRWINRLFISPNPQQLTDSLTTAKGRAPSTFQGTTATEVKNPAGTTSRRDVLRYLSRPFRHFAVLWGILLVTSTHLTIVWLCLAVFLVQLVLRIVKTLRLLLFSERWLNKYGSLMFAGLDKTLNTIDALKPDLTGEKEFEGLTGQLKLWSRILDFLKNEYLVRSWGTISAILIFGGLYVYFSFLFSFAYFGVARVSAYAYSWPESLVTSLFIPAYVSALPNVLALRVLGGTHFFLVVAVGVGTVMNFIKRRLDAVRKAATAYSERLSAENVRGKILVLEARFAEARSPNSISGQTFGGAMDRQDGVPPIQESTKPSRDKEATAREIPFQQLQQVAHAANVMSVAARGFQDAEIAAHDQAIVPEDTHRLVQKKLLTLAQAGLAADSIIANATVTAGDIARVNPDAPADEEIAPQPDVGSPGEFLG